MVIYVDTREPKKYIEFLRGAFPQLKFELATLKEGDYASERTIFERKTIADLYGSMVGPNKRIQEQVERISCHGDQVQGLLITGNLAEFVNKMKDPPICVNVDTDALFGLIGSIACRYGIQPFWIENEWHAMITMVKFMVKVDQGKYLVPNKRNPDILAAKLLGVSTRQLEVLLDNHKSIVGIAKASDAELMRVKGIGPAKIKVIRDMLT